MIVTPLRTTNVADQLASTETSFANRPSPLAPFTGEQAPGFLETAVLSFRTNSIVGQLGNAIDSFSDSFAVGRQVDPKFNPYDMMTDDFLKEHPYMMDDFESGRVLDIPNRESFFYYLAKKQEDYRMRARAGQGGFVANMVGAIAPDAGVYALTGLAGRATGVNPAVAQWLNTGNAATRIAKGAALGSVANVSNEGILEFINPDRNVDEAEAFRDAAVWGAAFGAAIPLGGKLLGAGKESLMNTSWGVDLRRRIQTTAAKSDALADLPKIVARESDQLDEMLKETPSGTKVITPLTSKTATAIGGDSTVSAKAYANGVKVEALKKRYTDAGYTLDIQPHPYQDFLDLTVSLNDLDANFKAVEPQGVVGKFAAGLNSILPGGKARAMPSAVARFLNHTLFDDAALLRGQADDPLNFKSNPSAESIKPQIEMLHVMAEADIGASFTKHFANKGKPITGTLSDGTQINAGSWTGYGQFRQAVTDYRRQASELKRGARSSITIDHPAIREAAGHVDAYVKKMFDRLDQAKMLRGPRALQEVQDQLTALTDIRKSIDEEIAKIGPAPVGPTVQAKSATTRSLGYKAAYKQRLAELEAVMPGDKANKASAKELAKQDVQQTLDAAAAKINAEIDSYAAKKAEIDGRAAKVDASIKAQNAAAREIEELISNANDYLTRRWLRHKIEGRRDDFTGRLKEQWQKNRTHDFKTNQPKNERPIVEEALDRLPAEDRQIIRDAGDEAKIPTDDGLAQRYENAVSQYFNDSANGVYDTLTDLDNAHGITTIMKTPNVTKARVLQIDETKFRDYLDQDIQSILGHYDQQLSGRIAVRIAIDSNAATWAPIVKEMTGEVFDGSTEQLVRATNRQFDKMLNEAADDAARAKINKARKQMDQIVKLKISELEGRPALQDGGSAAEAGWRAAGRTTMRLPYLSMMGNMIVTNLMDLAGLVLMTGLDSKKIGMLASSFRKESGFLPNVSRRGLEGIASALDQTGIRNMQLNEVFENPHDSAPPTSRMGKAAQLADKATGFLANKFGVVSGMNWLNTTTRRMAGHLILDEFVNGAKKMSKAQALIKGGMDQAKAFHQVGLAIEDAQRLNRLGFNAEKADELIDILTQHAVDFDGKRPWTDRASFMEHKGHISPEYEQWYQSNREMFDRFTAGINSEVNNIIVAPKSLSRPFMNARWIGRAVNQFWGFANAWSNQLAVAISQRPGREQALYFASIVGLASISDGIHNHISGRRSFEETANLWTDPKTSMAMMYKAVDRSGVLGWLSRPLGMMDREGYGPSKLLGGDNVSSRFLGNVKGRLGYLGPAFDYSDRLASGVIGTATKRDVRSLHLLRQTMPFQNLIHINSIYRFTKDQGLDNPLGGQGLDLFPIPTRPGFDASRPDPLPAP